MENYKFKKSMTETYFFRWGIGDWAKFYIDSGQYTFSCSSSFGEFAYNYWSPGVIGFKKFLISLNHDKPYLLKKISEPQFDLEESIKAWKNRIIDWRRTCWDSFSKEDARIVWNKIESLRTECPDGSEGEGFFYEKLSCIYEITDFDWWEDAYETSFPQNARFFVNEIFPMLADELRKELVADESD